MKWQHPFLFYLFLMLPVIIFLFCHATTTRKKRIQLFGSTPFQEKVKQSIHFQQRRLKILLVTIGFLLLIITLASPQTSSKIKVKKKLGTEFFLALDTSLSMLAQDETPSRFVNAKGKILHLLERLEGYRVGLVIFSGTSFVQCPLTMDYSAIRYFLESVDTQSLPVPGTDLKKVIENARKSFSEERGIHKHLILFTDGEDLTGDDPTPAAREATREGLTLFGIGFGSSGGAVIPLYENGVLTGYKKDGSGVTVVTSLNERLLTELAHATRGRYYKASHDDTELDSLMEEVVRQGKKEIVEQSESQYESRFQIPLFLALLILAFELSLSEERKRLET